MPYASRTGNNKPETINGEPTRRLRFRVSSFKFLVNRGFTLIELLIAIVIVGILASITAIATNSALQNARDGQRKSDINQIEKALKMYYAKYGEYPISGAPYYTGNRDNWSGLQPSLSTYLPKMPNDPKDVDGYFYYYARGDAAWITANPWTKLTMDCVNKRVLVALTMERSKINKQECTLSDLYGISIVLE